MISVLDPQGFLPGVEWRTRTNFLELGRRFARATGLVLRVRSGRRTCAEQDAIYAQGRETGGDVVTQASGCRSWHVVGRAVDADILLPNGAVSSRENDYATAGAIWKSLGGKWGGDFPGFWDGGHFEFHPGLTISQVCPAGVDCNTVSAHVTTKTPLYAQVGVPFWGMLIGGLAYTAWTRWKKGRR